MLRASARMPRYRQLPAVTASARGRCAPGVVRRRVALEVIGGLRRRATAHRLEPVQRVLQRAWLARVARQDLATAREARAVERQRQRDERTVVALLLGAPEPGKIAVGVAVVVDVDEIVEGDGVGQVEQRSLTAEQLPLDGGPVAPEQVADAIERLALLLLLRLWPVASFFAPVSHRAARARRAPA